VIKCLSNDDGAMTDRRCPHITHRTGCKLLCMQAAVNAELKPIITHAEAEAARLLLFAYLLCERPITWAVSSAVCCHHDYICSMCFFVLHLSQVLHSQWGIARGLLAPGGFLPPLHCSTPLAATQLTRRQSECQARTPAHDPHTVRNSTGAWHNCHAHLTTCQLAIFRWHTYPLLLKLLTALTHSWRSQSRSSRNRS
jgi:hypothetical protein